MCEARSTRGRRVVRSMRPAAVARDRNVGGGWAPQTTPCAYSGTGDGGGEGERERLRDAVFLDLEALEPVWKSTISGTKILHKIISRRRRGRAGQSCGSLEMRRDNLI